MAYITKFGSFWGMLPQTTGQYFFVAPASSYTIEGRVYEASDNNDGLSPERALRTIGQAVTNATASVGDVIVLLQGAHSTTATVTVNKAGLTITGIPGRVHSSGQRMPMTGKRNKASVTTTLAGGMLFTVTAADVEISFLHLIPITAGGAISSGTVSGTLPATRLYVHDCTIDLGSTTQTATFGITFPLLTGTAVHTADAVISHCYFQAGANVGPFVRAAGTCDGLTIQNSTFELIGAAAMDDAIECTQINLGTHIRDCDFFTPTAVTTVFTDCIDMTGATTDGSTQVYRCYFPAGSDAFEATATIDIETAENYLTTSTAGIITGSA